MNSANFCKRTNLAILVVLIVLTGLPAYAYADPSGGTLFQVLMPMLAALWATWMIFANRIRNAFTSLYRKLRGIEAEESVD